MKAKLAALAFAFFAMLLFAAPAMANTPKHIIHVGEQYLGTPYSQMNCSEFTRAVYGRAVHVWMPADTNAQKHYGWRIHPPTKGDLMFFRERGRHGVTHVGVYMGHGEILHSSSYYGEVVESPVKYIDGYLFSHRIR